MTRITKRKYCKDCEEYKLVEGQAPSVVVHLLLSIVTFGAWLPLWLLALVVCFLRGYRCTQCGRKWHV